jgi:hypothetical protein
MEIFRLFDDILHGSTVSFEKAKPLKDGGAKLEGLKLNGNASQLPKTRR